MSELRVRVLGGLMVEGVDDAGLGSRKARTLVKVLALGRSQPVRVDELVLALWGDLPPARPADQVTVLVSRLRRVLGADRLPRADGGYALRVDWLDLDALGDLVAEAERRLQAGATTAARTAAAAALALARGPLLPEEIDAEWAEADRALADRLIARARHAGASAALATGDPPSAADLASRALDHDPYDEAALRILMSAHVAAGRPASALGAYAQVRARLAEDLGVDPTVATEQLHRAILLAPDNEMVHSVPARPVAPPALPGRAAELARLSDALDRAEAGATEIVVVSGEAGIGKTRLLDVFAGHAAAAGRVVLRGRCEELARALPLQAVLDALDDHLGGLGPVASAALLGPEASVLAPLLGRATALVNTSLPALTDQLGAELRIFGALLDVIARAGAPVVLVVDDVHLAGQLTVAWLDYVARRGQGRHLLVVVGQRAEECHGVPATDSIELGPLDLDAATLVVGAERAGTLHARSGGNPLFLVELAEAESDELPASVRAAVAARCDRAGAAAATLRAAAVIGEEVDLELLATVLRASPIELLAHVEEGARRGLLVEHGATFVFRHDLVRDALASSTSAARRTLLHREAGRALASRAAHDPIAVAHHARLGGEVELAARALVDAASVASGRYDQVEAMRLLDQSIDLTRTVDAYVVRARVNLLRGAYAAASVDAEAALTIARDARALEVGAWAAHYQRDMPRAAELADDGAAIATDPAVRASCRTVGGWVQHSLGNLAEAERRLEEARALGDGRPRALAEIWLGGLRVHQGRVDEGLALIHPATIDEVELVHGYPPAHARLFRALGLAYRGRVVEALDTTDDLQADVERMQAGRWRGRAENVRGWIVRNLGALDEAHDCNTYAVEVTTASGMIEPLTHGLLDLACGSLLAGDVATATTLLNRADEARNVPHAMSWRNGLRCRLVRGRIALASDDPDMAEAMAAEIVTDADALALSRYSTMGAVLVAQARLARHDTVDLESLGAVLELLPAAASLEGWWLTADVARLAGTRGDPFAHLAAGMVGDVAAAAGPYRDTLERFAAAYFERGPHS